MLAVHLLGMACLDAVSNPSLVDSGSGSRKVLGSAMGAQRISHVGTVDSSSSLFLRRPRWRQGAQFGRRLVSTDAPKQFHTHVVVAQFATTEVVGTLRFRTSAAVRHGEPKSFEAVSWDDLMDFVHRAIAGAFVAEGMGNHRFINARSITLVWRKVIKVSIDFKLCANTNRSKLAVR